MVNTLCNGEGRKREMTEDHRKKLSESAFARHARLKYSTELVEKENEFLKTNTTFLQRMLDRATEELSKLKTIGKKVKFDESADIQPSVVEKSPKLQSADPDNRIRRTQSEKVISISASECICIKEGLLLRLDRKCRAKNHTGKGSYFR